MCLAIPTRVVELLPDSQAVVDLGGVRKTISLELVDGVVVGWPVEVNIFRGEDGKRYFHIYHHGREESHGLNQWKPGTKWLRYSAPKVVR